MAKKKNTQIFVSQEDNAVVQHLLEQYHQIAANLHKATDQQQAEAALNEINDMSEGAQLALLNVLAKEVHTDAADILSALHELSPLKSVRKQARRSLLRLENARIYPQWQPPVQSPLAAQMPVTPQRFWKGMVTDTRDAGEVQLMLCFEQEDGSENIRILGFLLEFWRDGIKDFFSRIESKQQFDSFVDRMASSMGDVDIKPCSLAEGRRLIIEAAAVNQQYGTPVHKDFRYNYPLVNRLVLSAPDSDEESEESDDLQDLDPEHVVIRFAESWAEGDYDTAYTLLSSESAIREGLTRAEWIERREAWADQSQARSLQPGFVHEREAPKSGLWLPNPFSAGHSTVRKEVEAGWSIELDELPPEDTLSELPEATAVYKETGRHWFWTSYVLVQEDNVWRIQSMNDEGANAQRLSIAELQKEINEQDKHLNAFVRKYETAKNLSEDNAAEVLDEILWRVLQSAYYSDALIKKLPLDRTIYEEAATRMFTIQQYERCIVYLDAIAHRFSERRGASLRQLAGVQRELSWQYSEKFDEEHAHHFRELAEEALRESLAAGEGFEARISLAEVLIEKNDQLEEAEELLLQAKALVTTSADEAHIEMHLGEIAVEQERYEEALSHYQRVATLEPDVASSWFDLGETYQQLGAFEEAEKNYKRAIGLQPDNVDYYVALSKMYTENGQFAKAVEVIEEGIRANPDSASLNVYLASWYIERRDYRQAEIYLQKAEELDPESPLVQGFRNVLNWSRSAPAASGNRVVSSNKQKRMRKKRR